MMTAERAREIQAEDHSDYYDERQMTITRQIREAAAHGFGAIVVSQCPQAVADRLMAQGFKVRYTDPAMQLEIRWGATPTDSTHWNPGDQVEEEPNGDDG